MKQSTKDTIKKDAVKAIKWVEMNYGQKIIECLKQFFTLGLVNLSRWIAAKKQKAVSINTVPTKATKKTK